MRNQSRTRMVMVAAALLACGSAKVLLAQNAPGAGPAPVNTPVLVPAQPSPVLVPAQPSQATTSPPAAPPPAVAAPAPAVAATPPAASAPPAAAAPVPAATTKTPAVLAPEPGTVATTPPASGPAASTPGAPVATAPAGSSKQGAQKKPTRVTRRHELERSIETGTVPERFRNSVPKEYQQYIPFAK